MKMESREARIGATRSVRKLLQEFRLEKMTSLMRVAAMGVVRSGETLDMI